MGSIPLNTISKSPPDNMPHYFDHILILKYTPVAGPLLPTSLLLH